MTTAPEPLWSDNRIAANLEDAGAYLDSYIGEKAFRIFQRARDEYEAERADYLAHIADLRRTGDTQRLLAQLDSLEAELAEARDRPKRGLSATDERVREGLLKGSVRAPSRGEPSKLRPVFDAALQMATKDVLMSALNLLIKHPNAKRTWRNYRIQRIDKQLREIMAAQAAVQP
jgi:hypothetical protein